MRLVPYAKPSQEAPDVLDPLFDLVVKGFEHVTDMAFRRAMFEDLKRDEDSAAAVAVASAPRRRQLP